MELVLTLFWQGAWSRSRAAKRLLDLTLTLLLLPVAIPLGLLIALLIRLDSRGPVFFVQKRLGHEGRYFRIVKFRTMHVGADRAFSQLPPAQRDEFRRQGKIRHDPRVTRVGRWLRLLSLDELPQFINVLRGEMSLVGPRAYVKRQVRQMGPYRTLIIQVPPGITGPWQVSGRSHISFPQRLQIDAEYAAGWTVWQDLQLICQTARVVVARVGSY